MAPQGPTGMPAAPPATPPLRGRGSVPVRRMRMGLGTWVVIEARGGSAACALQGLEGGFARIRHVEERMHPQRAGSDLAHLRQQRVGEPVAIDPSTWEVLKFAQQLFALSGGVFDPCLPHSAGNLGDLELSPDALNPWARARAALDIDCGGIAKGYAVDCAVDALRAAGCASGLVNAGGDLRVYGPLTHPLLLRCPDGSYLPCELHEAAVAVSDLDATNRPSEHRGYYVRKATAGARRRYAAVRAPQAMVADALTKCVMLCAPALAQTVVHAMSAEILA